jgi:erythromycin esterase-like protein
LEYLASVDGAGGQERYQRIESLVGDDAEWESAAALADPTRSVGLSPAATSLRIETEDLIPELRTPGPELVTRTGASRYAEALHYASLARQLMNFHAAIARRSGLAHLLAIRDAAMADTLAYVVARERGRGKVLAFAHNKHVQRGQARWAAGSDE